MHSTPQAGFESLHCSVLQSTAEMGNPFWATSTSNQTPSVGLWDIEISLLSPGSETLDLEEILQVLFLWFLFLRLLLLPLMLKWHPRSSGFLSRSGLTLCWQWPESDKSVLGAKLLSLALTITKMRMRASLQSPGTFKRKLQSDPWAAWVDDLCSEHLWWKRMSDSRVRSENLGN